MRGRFSGSRCGGAGHQGWGRRGGGGARLCEPGSGDVAAVRGGTGAPSTRAPRAEALPQRRRHAPRLHTQLRWQVLLGLGRRHHHLLLVLFIRRGEGKQGVLCHHVDAIGK